MRKLHLLTAAAGILLAITGPSLAATRHHQASRANSAYAQGSEADRSGAYYYGPRGGASTPTGTQGWGGASYNDRYPTTGNLPYPDRPYGDPDSW